ncbi:MAG: hypothetical protein HYS27_07305 [Deltaproteobacteria bacterium]|nr:hypothetical protein [Deltaproteobacteria bacterium]
MPTLLAVAALLIASLADDAGYQKGRALYESFEYEQALLRFQELSARADLTPAERAEVILWVALCLDGVGRGADADTAMLDALRLHDQAVLPVATSPQLEARFQTAVAAARAERDRLPPPPPPPPPTAGGGPSGLAIGLGAGSAVALLGSAALGIAAGERWAVSTDPSRFVDERQAAHGVYAWCLGGAVVGGLVGAGLAAGTVLALTAPDEATAPAATGTGG